MNALRSACLVFPLLAAACGRSDPPPPAPAPPPAPPPAMPVEPVPDSVSVPMTLIDDRGSGSAVGTVQLSDGASGLTVTAELAGLPPGLHGLHFHMNPSCAPAPKDGKPTAGEAAGEHYDPAGTGTHAGPHGPGHAGDLPQLEVAADGSARVSLTAPKLKLAEVRNRALVIHADADNYADSPGGARIACGVVR